MDAARCRGERRADPDGDARRRATLATATACDEALWREFADLGWLALTVPEDAGGLGAGLLEACLLAEELGRHLVLEPVLTQTVA